MTPGMKVAGGVDAAHPKITTRGHPLQGSAGIPAIFIGFSTFRYLRRYRVLTAVSPS
jgi:hypothetical protein